jgi:uncharacterized protein (DUF2141 family)
MKFLAHALLASSLFAGAATAATLTVVVSNVTSEGGKMNFAVYDSKDAWLEDDTMVAKQTLVVADELREGTVTTSFELEPGDYAVSVHHDENDNGKMDTRIFPPIPKEPVGASNDAEPKFGPPKYKDAVFTLGEDGVKMPIKLLD